MNQISGDIEVIDTEDEPPIRKPSLINIRFSSKRNIRKKRDRKKEKEENEILNQEDSMKKQRKSIGRFFKIGGSIFLISGIAVLIIGFTGGMAIIPLIAGGYLTGCGAFNMMVKI